MEKGGILLACLCGVFILVVLPAGAEETGEYLHYRIGMKYKVEKNYDKAIDEFRKVLTEYPDNYNVYMHIAEIRMAQNQPRLAVANLKQALSYNPGWGKAHLMLADAYEKDKQLPKAVGEYQQFQQGADPVSRDSVQKVIDRLVAKIGGGGALKGKDSTVTAAAAGGKPGAAAETAAAPEKPETPPALPENPKAAELFKRAVASYAAKKYDSALSQCKGVIELQPGFSGAYYYAGIIRYNLGQYKLSKINLHRGIAYFEPSATGLMCLGKMYYEEKKYREAVRHLSKYGKVSSSEAGKKEAAQLIARCRALMGKAGNAPDSTASQAADGEGAEPAIEPCVLEVRIDSLLSMVSPDSLSDEGQQLLSGIHEFQLGNYDQAIREFKKIMAAHPSGTVAVHCIYNCGISYFKLRLLREAENQFQQIIDRYPRHSLAGESLFLKALTYSERKETNVAEGLFREFLQAFPRHRWAGKAWEKLGDTYVDMEQTKKAIDAYAQGIAATKSCPDQVSVFFKSGNAYFAIGNTARGFACFDSAISKGERCGVYVRVPDSYYRIADEKYKLKEYASALTCYEKATRKFPAFQETPWGLFQIGNIQKNLQQFQQAIDTYTDLIKRFPDDYWAKQAQWKLDDAVWAHEYQTTLH